MQRPMQEAHLRIRLPKDLTENFEKRLKAEVLQTEMQRLVNTYGLCTVLDALSDEAARMVLTSYCRDAVKIHDVLRACQEEICDQSMK
jgi:exopolyphosphatase/pppGpp-phosphohydrolase